MKIKIYTTIQNKNKINTFHLDMLNEYVKRLSKYSKTEIIFGNKKVKKFSKNTHIFLVNNQHTESSEHFAEKINSLAVSGVSEIIFLYDKSQLELVDSTFEQFSVSTMDFSLETNMAVLLEQIYRAYKILNNENYHK